MKRLLLPLLLSLLCQGCSEDPQAPSAAPPPVPVTVSISTKKEMPLVLDAPGQVEPVRTVSILSRVTGQLEKIGFGEGQNVAKDEVLFTIDSKPFVEKIREAESRLAMHRANLEFQRAEARRYAGMVGEGTVSESDIEKTRADAMATEALIRADGACLAQARLDLSYCTIRAPFAGRTGSRLVHEGAIVEANTTVLTVINQMTPIHVRFAVPERHLTTIRHYMTQHPLEVLAFTDGGAKTPLSGRLVFIDNAIDAATGMIALKAEFENADQILWPGQYVQARLILDLQKDALTVPLNAVMTGQQGFYLFVVRQDNTAAVRAVDVDRRIGGEAVISSGLEGGETVVLTGQNKLQEGFKVRILEALQR
ncbi:efflux RND transporter periplasmic adaptor subunit [Desulfatiglans anilini]|uniref:efflux RND transporter periplasmic adaptor subunit n=1 Tax=Desulfatiglans anilini TaxID=90728 RepID=UPI00042A5926|nr:efflux RND transporter periplasmic adaptor subunit [Desulfatiglans anilini]